MVRTRNNQGILVVSAFIMGLLYVVIGLAEFILAIWNWFIDPSGNLSLPYLPSRDLFGGFSSLTIGAVYLRSLDLLKGRNESLGFTLVGALLAGAYSVVYMLIIGADGLNAYLSHISGEEFTWEWLTQGTLETGILRPEIWLGLASLPLLILTLKNLESQKSE